MQTDSKSILILLSIGILLLLATLPFTGSKTTDAKPYSHFIQDLTTGKVARATISGTRLSAVYLNGARHTIVIPDADPQIHQLLLTHGAEVVYLDARTAKGGGGFLLVLLAVGAAVASTCKGAVPGEDRGRSSPSVRVKPGYTTQVHTWSPYRMLQACLR